MRRLVLALLLVAAPAFAQNRIITKATAAQFFGANDARYVNVTGDETMAGSLTTPDLRFSGTTTSGLRVKSLTTVQRDVITPAAGDVIWNSTDARYQIYNGAAWFETVRRVGDTLTGPLLLPDGTAAAPALAWSADADGSGTGWFRSSANTITASVNGTQHVTLNSVGLALPNDGFVLRFGSGTDVILGRAAAAHPQWGANSATPVAYTHNLAPSAVGTDIAGARATIRSGAGTGASVPSLLAVQGETLGVIATGATVKTTANGGIVDRAVFGATKVLTDNVAVPIVNVTAASNTVAAVIIKYAVEVFNGTDLQVEHGEIGCTVINKGGVFSGNVCTKYGNAQVMSSGTLAVTAAITAANPAVVSINANPSLTPSAGYPRMTFELSNLTQQAVALP